MIIVQEIKRIHKETRSIYGYRRLKIALETNLKITINKKKIQRLQKRYNLHAHIRRKREKFPKLDFSKEEPKMNLLKRNFYAKAPNEKWVTDITHIKVGAKRLYMSVLMDLFNREILSYKISKSPTLELVLETFEHAFSTQKSNKVIIHSDQGSHYTSKRYCSLLRKNNAIQSMSRKANCLDNASMENFFGHLKCELINRLKPMPEAKIRNSVADYIDFYNYRRIQSKFKMAPVEYRSHFDYAYKN